MTLFALYNFTNEVVILNRIRFLRQQAGLKQSELAAILNCSNTAVSKYELGQLDLGVETIKALCKIFNCSADYLLGLSDLQKPELSEVEISFLLAYRKADAHVKDLVRLALDPFWEDEQSERVI